MQKAKKNFGNKKMFGMFGLFAFIYLKIIYLDQDF